MPSRHARYTDLPASFIKEDIRTERQGGVGREAYDHTAPGLFYQTKTHVLLAACGADESAYEESGRGVFTRALLDTLGSVGEERVTYEELVKRMPILPGYVKSRLHRLLWIQL